MLLTKTRKFQIKKKTLPVKVRLPLSFEYNVLSYIFFTFLRYISYEVAKFGCFYLNIEEIING